MVDIYLLILSPVALLNSLISSRKALLGDGLRGEGRFLFGIFYSDKSSISSFLICVPPLSFLCHITVASTSSNILNNNNESRPFFPCFQY